MCEQHHGTVFDQFLNDKKDDFDGDRKQGQKRKFLLISTASKYELVHSMS